jgi:uncharacterized protein (DUF362 family)/Pyruvate/2-oxoacid:ferredoxin oxidoreductase delta subunit
MSRVIVRPATYDEDVLRPVIFALMDGMGGAQLDRASRVLIKPNLLRAARPDRALLTHSAVVRCVVEYCLDKGVRPTVADSPALGSFETILRMSGIREALAGTGVECRPFRESVKIDVGEPFGEIDIAEEAVRSDVIINLPKFKTHSQMLLTLAVKNLFGCIVGFRKPEWHLRAGADRQAFARLLVRIGRTLRPAFNILDGILAMEGEGPGLSGVPRELGILLAGKDPFAVDSVACRVIGLDPEDLPLLKAAAAEGPLPEPTIDGVLPDVRGFRLPCLTPLLYGPRFLHGFIRRHILRRPVCDANLCHLCGECVKICPARAITPEEETLRFDYDRCIRCYCCIEVCPAAALRSAVTLAGKLSRRMIFPVR